MDRGMTDTAPIAFVDADRRPFPHRLGIGL
jgi:hypothetical protein